MSASEEHEQHAEPLAAEIAGRAHIRRRDLLAWGGAAVMLPAFPGILRAQESAAEVISTASAADAAPQPMSVGFVEGSDSWRLESFVTGWLNRGMRSAPDAVLEGVTVVPATSLVAGDQQLANQVVRVHVHGLYPVPNPLTVKSAYLTVFFPADNPARLAGPLPFLAWGYKCDPVPDVPAPVGFPIGLGPTGELEMRLDVVSGLRSRRDLTATLPGGHFTTTFTVDWFAGRPRLQQGVYLLGLSPDVWATERRLPTVKTGHSRPLDLLSLAVSFEPIAA